MVWLSIIQDPDGQIVIPGPWPDLTAAILSHWVSLMLICMIVFLIDWDARLKIALWIWEVMIGLNWCTR